MTIKSRIYLLDTTLRDGAQTPGLDFSLDEKRHIAAMLDDFGIDYIEGGYPGANPIDTAFFETNPLSHATFTAFGMTKRVGWSVENDPGLQSLTQSAAPAICYVAKSWDKQVEKALGITLDENLQAITQSVHAALEANKEAIVDCEHFFDGYKSNHEFAIKCVSAALGAGARWVVLCDTNGGTMPQDIGTIISELIDALPGDNVGDRLGIHAHNDTEQAVANSLVAISAGVRQVQGTLNGIGERCGNCNLISLIPTLMLKPAYKDAYEVGISAEKLAKITEMSRAFEHIINRRPHRQSPYVGSSAFATKAGIHASAIRKDPTSYEHIEPELVGNQRQIMVSQQAGKSNLLDALEKMKINVDKTDQRLDMLLAEVKQREAIGYAYDGAAASFYLLARKMLGTLPDYFKVISYRSMVERRIDAKGSEKDVSEAVVKISVDGNVLMSVAESDSGPINALDQAMRKDLGQYNVRLSDLELVDFKVRIMNGGTDAVTRVLVESRNAEDTRWFTVGVSPNIIKASFEALKDSIVYHLLQTEV